MKNDSTELVFVIDRSGSMSGLEKDTIGGFNSTIEKQRKTGGDVTVSTVLFSTVFDRIHDRIPIGSVRPLTEDDYCVNGCTALLDAVGDSIKHTEKVYSYMAEGDVPARTMFVIITDGCENSSREFTYDKVRSLIDRKTEEGWEFIFLGANIDVAKEASKIGIRRDHCAEYKCDTEGMEVCYNMVDRAISDFRKDISVERSEWSRRP